MAREDSAETLGLRDIFDIHEKYDVFLACAFEPKEIEYSNKNLEDIFEFYDKIGNLIEKIGKRPYLPHREIDLKWDPGKIYCVPCRIVIPTSDIVIGYLGINSLAAGIMIVNAQLNNIPMSYLYNEYKDLSSVRKGIIIKTEIKKV